MQLEKEASAFIEWEAQARYPFQEEINAIEEQQKEKRQHLMPTYSKSNTKVLHKWGRQWIDWFFYWLGFENANIKARRRRLVASPELLDFQLKAEYLASDLELRSRELASRVSIM